MSSLLIVATRYPVGYDFVEAELPYLTRYFSAVHVITPSTSEHRSAIPVGIEADTSFARQLRSGPKIIHPKARRILTAFRDISQSSSLTKEPSTSPRPGGNFPGARLRVDLEGRAAAQAAFRWARVRKPPSLVYSYWLSPFCVGLRKAWPKVPIVSRAHGFDIYPIQLGLTELPWQREAISSCDRIFCVTEHGRDYLAKLYPRHCGAIQVRRIGTSDPGGVFLDHRLQQINILSVSSVDVNKRVDRIFDVVENLHSRGHNVSWTHAGDGPQFDQLTALVEKSDCRGKVSLLGHVPHQVVQTLLRSRRFNVFLNQSMSEGAPVSLMEAQSVGLPCVATDVGGTSEVLAAPGNHIHAPNLESNDVASLVIEAVHSSREDAQSRRDYFLRNFLETLNYSAFADELRAISEGLTPQSE